MQFKFSTATGKIKNVAVICAEETAAVVAHKRNVSTASRADVESGTCIKAWSEQGMGHWLKQRRQTRRESK